MGACWSVVYRCLNKNHGKKYFFQAGQCAALSSFRAGKSLFAGKGYVNFHMFSKTLLLGTDIRFGHGTWL